MHCVKSIHIKSYSGPRFSREYEYGHFLRIDGIGELYNESGKTQLWYSWKVAVKEFILVRLQLPSLYLYYKLISFAGLLQGFWQKSVKQLIV